MKSKRNDVFQNKSIKVPFVVPNIDSSDKKAIAIALKSNLLTDGPILRKFEKEFSRFTGSKYAIGVSNATSALQLSLKSLGIGKGDEVIIPDITFVATANAVLFTGATPVLADVNEDDLNISINSIDKNITKKTKAIVPVHFAGKSCDMKSIQKFAKDNDLKIIEDCAHALGTKFDKKHVGTFGETGCFSFYPTKNLTTFEGGMIITQSKKMAENLRSLRNHGITKSLQQRFTKGHPWDFDIKQMGYNFRIDEIRSSLGLSQLKKIKKMNKLRRSACKYYNKNLKNIDGVYIYEDPKLESNSCHLYVIKILSNFGITRNNLFANFIKNGIRTSVHYKPLHKFSLYKNKCKIYFPLKISKLVYPQILSLPLFPQITKNEMNSVITVLKKQQK